MCVHLTAVRDSHFLSKKRLSTPRAVSPARGMTSPSRSPERSPTRGLQAASAPATPQKTEAEPARGMTLPSRSPERSPTRGLQAASAPMTPQKTEAEPAAGTATTPKVGLFKRIFGGSKRSPAEKTSAHKHKQDSRSPDSRSDRQDQVPALQIKRSDSFENIEDLQELELLTNVHKTFKRSAEKDADRRRMSIKGVVPPRQETDNSGSPELRWTGLRDPVGRKLELPLTSVPTLESPPIVGRVMRTSPGPFLPACTRAPAEMSTH